MRNYRIKAFKFRWCDAWYSRGWGYEAILTIGTNGSWINFLIDGKPFKFDLANKEDEFVQSLESCNVMDWDKKFYVDDYAIDGYDWKLELAYDEKHMRAHGSNGYPREFESFMSYFHNNGLPWAQVDGQKGWSFKEELKWTKIKSY